MNLNTVPLLFVTFIMVLVIVRQFERGRVRHKIKEIWHGHVIWEPVPSITKITFLIQSLKNRSRIRTNVIKNNQLILPKMEIFESINGYNKNSTLAALFDMNLKYVKLDSKFETYGTLANTLTKVKAWEYQIDNNLTYMCLIEDDILIKQGFEEFIESHLQLFEKYNILRLDEWGEGYCTSLKGAVKTKDRMYKLGILHNIDNQLRFNHFNEKRIYGTPWKLIVDTNKGDILKTEWISNDTKKMLQKTWSPIDNLYLISQQPRVSKWNRSFDCTIYAPEKLKWCNLEYFYIKGHDGLYFPLQVDTTHWVFNRFFGKPFQMVTNRTLFTTAYIGQHLPSHNKWYKNVDKQSTNANGIDNAIILKGKSWISNCWRQKPGSSHIFHFMMGIGPIISHILYNPSIELPDTIILHQCIYRETVKVQYTVMQIFYKILGDRRKPRIINIPYSEKSPTYFVEHAKFQQHPYDALPLGQTGSYDSKIKNKFSSYLPGLLKVPFDIASACQRNELRIGIFYRTNQFPKSYNNFRRFSNMKEVIETAKKISSSVFTFTTNGSMTILEQAKAYNSFDILITPHGSQNVNAIWINHYPTASIEIVANPVNTQHWKWITDHVEFSEGHRPDLNATPNCLREGLLASRNCDLFVNLTKLERNIHSAKEYICNKTKNKLPTSVDQNSIFIHTLLSKYTKKRNYNGTICTSTFFFVTGFHHSGTTIVQHSILRALGFNITRRYPERLPRGCPQSFSVFKWPAVRLNKGIYNFTKSLEIRKRYPNVRIIYLKRDIPNVLWSIYKRDHGKKTIKVQHFKKMATRILKTACSIHSAWRAHKFDKNDFSLDLYSFTHQPIVYLKNILGLTYGRRLDGTNISSSTSDIPLSHQHDLRRAWQAKHAIYPDDIDLYKKEMPKNLSTWLSKLTCTD